MAGNEERLARLARVSNIINTGAPKAICPLCRFCVANDFSFHPHVDLIDDAEFEAQLDAIERQTFDLTFLPPGVEFSQPAIWFSYKEPFYHPKLCEFVEVAAARVPQRRIYVVTVGLLVKRVHVERLNALPNVTLGISFGTFDPASRAVLYGHPKLANLEYVMQESDNLAVMFTDVGSTEQVERDLDRYLSLRRGSVTWSGIRRLEHTRFAPPDVVALSHLGIANLNRTIEKVLDRVDMYSTTDLDTILRFGVDKCEIPDLEKWIERDRLAFRHIVDQYPSRHFLFCSAASSFAFWSRELAEYGDLVEVVRIPSGTLGGSMDCAGLMSIEDVLGAIGDPGDRLLVVPRAMFGTFDHDLLELPVSRLPDNCVVAESSFSAD